MDVEIIKGLENIGLDFDLDQALLLSLLLGLVGAGVGWIFVRRHSLESLLWISPPPLLLRRCAPSSSFGLANSYRLQAPP